DELQMTYDESGTTKKLFQVVTRDESTGELVAKVVNTAPGPVRTQVEVSDVAIEPTGTVLQLTGAPGATNTKANPDALVPKEREISGLSESFEYEFPGSSVTFLRMRTDDGVAPEITELAIAGDEAGGWYADPATVRISATDNRAVDHLEVRVDGGAWQTLPGDSGEVEVTGDGQHTVEARAVDTAGNVGEIRPLTFGIDATAPVTQAIFDADSRTVTLLAADTGAGVERSELRLGATGDWETYDGPVDIGIAATTVEYRSVDRLGNTEAPGRLDAPAADGAPKESTVVALVSPASVSIGTDARVKVRVQGADGTPTGPPTGPVTVSTGDRVVATGTLADGRATLLISSGDLGVGSHPLTVRYAGDAAYSPSEDALTLRVQRATSRTRVTVRPNPVRPAQQARVVVRVSSTTQVNGVARVQVRRGKRVVKRTVGLTRGRGVVRLPALPQGRYRVTAVYAGSGEIAGSRSTIRLRVTAR
ncbi:Ig-like domain repeat protein, partial [Nocardioides sp.]|uniref:OmpL47-type beta-barrel domain-containing protein n=1 Tax=Nocardioides sp. TaxID=35761 RepID=UPI002736CCC1